MSHNSNEGSTVNSPPLRRALVVGTAWMVGLRWTIKFAGLISTMILARLLTPGDFGLVAMSMVVVAFVGVIFEFGTDYALISKPDAIRGHYDAAWSLRVIQGMLAAGIIVVVAPFAATYYGDDRVLTMLLVLSGGVLFRSFANIGVVDFRKKLQFAKEFMYLVSVKVVTIPFTIALAIWLRSYWALIAGILIGYGLEVVLSYLMHPLRPKFALEKGRDIWMFSKWMILFQIANYLTMTMDRFVLGGLTAAKQVGLYSLSGEIAHLPSAELVAPISRALVPGFAKLKSQPRRLDAAYLKTVAAAASIGIPASVGLSLVADEVVPLFLGAQWDEAVPFLRWLALHGALLTLYGTSANLLMVTNEIRFAAVVAGMRATAFLALMYPAFVLDGVLGVIYAKLAASFFALVILWVIIVSRRTVSIWDMVAHVWRPVVSAAVMAGVLIEAGQWFTVGTLAALTSKVSLGAMVYGVVLVGLWKLFGKRNDIEGDILEIVRAKVPGFVGK